MLTPLFFAQGFPASMCRHMLGGGKQRLEHLTPRIIAEAEIIVVEQHLDADRTLNQGQLLIEQAAGKHTQIIPEANVLGVICCFLLLLAQPDPAPQVQGVSRQRQNNGSSGEQQQQVGCTHARIRRRGTF